MNESVSQEAERTPVERKKFANVIFASMAGSVVEWYEFFLYGTASALVFGHIFFRQTGDPLDGVIAALLTYAVGFVARPVGGIVFGYYGDRFGRKRLLQVSLLLVGASTFLMGALPTFDQVGYLAPALLVALRFIQGFAVGGEWGGAVLLVAEHSPDAKRGFWSSFPQAGAPVGNVLATVVLIGLSSTLSDEDFLSWGWRIAFFLSAVIVFIGWFVRQKVEDAPIFQESMRDTPQDEVPASTLAAIVQVVKLCPRQVATAMGLRVVENILYYMVVTFSLTYMGVFLGMDTSKILVLMLIGHVFHAVAIVAFGALSDRIGRRAVYGIGVVLTGGYGFVAFPLMRTESSLLILLAICLGLLLHAIMYAPQPAIMAEMFPTRMRYIGLSLGAQVTAIFAGSLAPFIATSLLRRYDSTIPIAIYLAIAALISLIAVAALRETRGIDLETLDRTDRKTTPA